MYKKLILYSIIVLFIGAFTPVAHARETVFSLPYGAGDQQIAVYVPPDNVEEGGDPSGPFWFFVDRVHDTFYIADDTLAIKKFTLTGQFLGKIPIDLQSMRSFCLDSEENIYIIHGVACEELSKVSNTGQILWTKSISEILQGQRGQDMFATYLYIDPNGFLYLEITRMNDVVYAKLDKDGSFVENVPSNYIDGNGNYHLFKPVYSFGNLFIDDRKETGDYKSSFDIDVFGKNKSLIKTLKVSFPEEYKNFDTLRDVLEQTIDSKENIYLLTFVRRDPINQDILDNGLWINSDNIIYKFNSVGELVSKIQFPNEGIMNLEKRFQVDNEGNLYYLNFYANKMDVVKIPPTIPFSQFSLKHWRINWNQGKHDKNKFHLSGRIGLPDDYTLDMLQKKGTVTVAIKKKDSAPFSQTATLDFKQHGPIWQYKAPKAQKDTEPLDIEKMLIFWQPEGLEDKPDKQGHAGKYHGKRAGWFMIQGNINISDTAQAALLPKAALTLNIPVENITTAGALESTEEVEFKANKNLWFYNAAPHHHWQDWQDNWWEKVKEE